MQEEGKSWAPGGQIVTGGDLFTVRDICQEGCVMIWYGSSWVELKTCCCYGTLTCPVKVDRCFSFVSVFTDLWQTQEVELWLMICSSPGLTLIQIWDIFEVLLSQQSYSCKAHSDKREGMRSWNYKFSQTISIVLVSVDLQRPSVHWSQYSILT